MLLFRFLLSCCFKYDPRAIWLGGLIFPNCNVKTGKLSKPNLDPSLLKNNLDYYLLTFITISLVFIKPSQS